jgi:molybdenum cofactor cytidylyltransferase
MIAAVVLAAGASSRMGRPKQTIPLHGVPMLEMALESFRRSNVGRVVVVLGANAVEVRKRMRFAHEVVVVNEAFSEGMSSSLRLGLENTGEADAAIIAMGDQPFVLPDTINRMIAAYDESRARIVIPTYRGARGNPVLFDRSVFSQIKEIRGDVGAKAVVQRNAGQVLEVEVPDGGVLIDIDTPSDLDRGSGFRRRRNRARA